MSPRSGTADLALHSGRVPHWLAHRMASLGARIIEIMAEDLGRNEVLHRFSDPYWFQALGCVLGMDWHSSGITTSVMGALKRNFGPECDLGKDLGFFICGGRGKHSRKTPEELQKIANRTGLDGDALVRTSRLVARVDNNAVQDGFNLYLHDFILSIDGQWVIVQQGMNADTRTARRYHWKSDGLRSFVDQPHQAVVGKNQGIITNLTDRQALQARTAMVQLFQSPLTSLMRELRALQHLEMPKHHDIRPSDVLLRRLEKILRYAQDTQPSDFESLLLVPGLGPAAVSALALLCEVMFAHRSRFRDPARFAFAHGGKDGHPFPVRLDIYDHSIRVLHDAIRRARLNQPEKLQALKRLDRNFRAIQ